MIRPLGASAKSCLKDRRGVSAIEFALVLPVLAIMGMGGLEMSQYAITIHLVTQSANSLADNMSRVGANSSLTTTQLRERDIVDGFYGMIRQNPTLNIPGNGRVILSSLERNSSGGQWIHWQRCIGTMAHASTYGNAGDGVTGTSFAGMGPTGSKIQTPPGSGQAVMFVEVAYQYTPMFTDLILPSRVITSDAAFIVRSPRDLAGTGLFNPSPAVATPYICSRYTAR